MQGSLTTKIPTITQYIKTVPKGGLLSPKLQSKAKKSKRIKICP